MGKQKAKNHEKHKLTHDAFFEETFGMPSLGIAFLKNMLSRKLLKHLDLDQLKLS